MSDRVHELSNYHLIEVDFYLAGKRAVALPHRRYLERFFTSLDQ
jgi:hypothetical protein